MFKEFLNKYLLKSKLDKLLGWDYYLETLDVDYSKFMQFKDKYSLKIKHNKSFIVYYLDLAYNSNLTVDEVAGLIDDFIRENCTEVNIDKRKAKEVRLSNYYEELSRAHE